MGNYKKNIKFFIDNGCPYLASEKQNTTPHDSLGTVTSTSPMEIRATNFFKVDKTDSLFEHILVIIGQFTRYTQAYTDTNKSTKISLKTFQWFCVETWNTKTEYYTTQ